MKHTMRKGQGGSSPPLWRPTGGAEPRFIPWQHPINGTGLDPFDFVDTIPEYGTELEFEVSPNGTKVGNDMISPGIFGNQWNAPGADLDNSYEGWILRGRPLRSSLALSGNPSGPFTGSDTLVVGIRWLAPPEDTMLLFNRESSRPGSLCCLLHPSSPYGTDGNVLRPPMQMTEDHRFIAIAEGGGIAICAPIVYPIYTESSYAGVGGPNDYSGSLPGDILIVEMIEPFYAVSYYNIHSNDYYSPLEFEWFYPTEHTLHLVGDVPGSPTDEWIQPRDPDNVEQSNPLGGSFQFRMPNGVKAANNPVFRVSVHPSWAVHYEAGEFVPHAYEEGFYHNPLEYPWEITVRYFEHRITTAAPVVPGSTLASRPARSSLRALPTRARSGVPVRIEGASDDAVMMPGTPQGGPDVGQEAQRGGDVQVVHGVHAA